MAVVKGKKTSNDIKNNGTMSEDEVVASDVPPRYLFLFSFLFLFFLEISIIFRLNKNREKSPQTGNRKNKLKEKKRSITKIIKMIEKVMIFTSLPFSTPTHSFSTLLYISQSVRLSVCLSNGRLSFESQSIGTFV